MSDYSREEIDQFVGFLRETLSPDLKSSGNVATAYDFEKSAEMLTQLLGMTYAREDKRTLAQLAQEALDVQNAVNLSGIVLSWSRSVIRLRELLPSAGTREINEHCVNVLFVDKLTDLTRHWDVDKMPVSAAYSAAQKLVG